MSATPPNKRQRLPRACVLHAKQRDVALSCDLLDTIKEYLFKHSHDDDHIQALLSSIDTFRQTHATSRSDSPLEQKDQDTDDGIDLNDEDSWSDELSEHESDREFIAPSDEDPDGSSYVPSESEDESTQDIDGASSSSSSTENKENESWLF